MSANGRRRSALVSADYVPPDPVPANHWQSWAPRTLRRRHLSLLFTLGILMALGGWWAWPRAQVGLAQVEAELKAEIVSELWSKHAPSIAAEVAEARILGDGALPADPGEILTQVVTRDLGKDRAVVDVTLQATVNGPSYRQTRLYHEHAGGWLRTQPTAARWGRSRQFESRYFVFAYQALDHDAVLEAAARLDVLYPQLYRVLYRKVPAHAKQLIRVDPAYTPGAFVPDGSEKEGIVIASPAATLMPSAMAASDLLLQSLVLALYDQLARAVLQDATLSSNSSSNKSSRLHDALRLWLIWEHDLPLAVWRKPLLRWLYKEPQDETLRGASDVPPFARDLCAHFSLFMQSPLEVAVPMLCWQRRSGEAEITAWRNQPLLATLSLDPMIYRPAVDMDDMTIWQDVTWPEPGSGALVLATVFEYVSATYGVDALLMMLAAISQHERAETLIPAVFGVTFAEFTTQWRTFIEKRYF